MRTSLVTVALVFVVAACGPTTDPAPKETRSADVANLDEDRRHVQSENERLHSELEDLATRQRELQEKLAEQSREIERARAALAESEAKRHPVTESVPSAPPADPPKTIHGVVQACNNNVEIVIVSVGSRDSVDVGSEFSVERDGKPVATIVIDKVFPNYASGTFKPGTPKTAIQAGDVCVGSAPRTSVCLPK
jgi:hypothetical protein